MPDSLSSAADSHGNTPITCARCGTRFGCGARAQTACWCAALPPVSRIDSSLQTCLCPDCLRTELAAQAGMGGA